MFYPGCLFIISSSTEMLPTLHWCSFYILGFKWMSLWLLVELPCEGWWEYSDLTRLQSAVRPRCAFISLQSISVCASMSVHLCLSISVCVSMCVHLSVHLCLYIYVCTSLSVHLSVHLSVISVCTSMSVWQSVHSATSQSVWGSFDGSVCCQLRARLSVFLLS